MFAIYHLVLFLSSFLTRRALGGAPFPFSPPPVQEPPLLARGAARHPAATAGRRRVGVWIGRHCFRALFASPPFRSGWPAMSRIIFGSRTSGGWRTAVRDAEPRTSTCVRRCERTISVRGEEITKVQVPFDDQDSRRYPRFSLGVHPVGNQGDADRGSRATVRHGSIGGFWEEAESLGTPTYFALTPQWAANAFCRCFEGRGKEERGKLFWLWHRGKARWSEGKVQSGTQHELRCQ